MITGITLENFKGIRDRIDIKLRPITLLFGPNSAGKSTISDALYYLEAILTSKSANPHQFHNQDHREFNDLVHGQDPKRQITIGLTSSLTTDDDGYFNISANEFVEEQDQWGAPTSFDSHLTDEKESLTIELTIGSALAQVDGGLVRSAQITKFKVNFNGLPFVEIVPRAGERGRLRPFLWKVFFTGILNDDRDDEEDEITFVAYNTQIFPQDFDPPLTKGFYVAESAEQTLPSPAVAVHLNSHVLAAMRIVLYQLRSRRSLGPIRKVPDTGFMPRADPNQMRWVDGLAAWDYLAYCGEDALIDINVWLVRLSAGFAVVQRHLVDLKQVIACLKNSESDQRKQMFGLAELRLACRREVRLARANSVEDAAEIWVHPTKIEVLLWPSEVGSGVSQLIPVVVLARDATPGFALIRQPELHLHPRVQAELGDLFIESFKRFKHTFLIETHSEHLILRMCRRIRETHCNTADKSFSVLTDDIAVYFVGRREGVTTVDHIELDVQGEFIQPWPDDFFEIDFYERFG